jgi:Flp pilus assembly CpaF family ATPase
MTLPRHPYNPAPMTDEQRVEASARFLEVMGRRRSIREFARAPVPRQLVVNAIRAAARTSSHGHSC